MIFWQNINEIMFYHKSCEKNDHFVNYASFIDPVKYEAKLEDGAIVAKTREEGMEFYLNDGNEYISFEINNPHSL